ncbi:unknown protein [Desulfotalea psychrophila LSv54]|uniref:Uncharacterized protein n=1 Tax=Desulfotalea psychrophila (strain LSv54 / DSM 12343) TaxID=177439 RepID=Q6AQB2_DESPS|nr:unknown protein [Desulfotalea psychrophila LSv54]
MGPFAVCLFVIQFSRIVFPCEAGAVRVPRDVEYNLKFKLCQQLILFSFALSASRFENVLCSEGRANLLDFS